MANNTRFIGVDASIVDLEEKKSSANNALTEVYTAQELGNTITNPSGNSPHSIVLGENAGTDQLKESASNGAGNIAIGNDALGKMTNSGSENMAIGSGALSERTTNSYSQAFGNFAGKYDNGYCNFWVGAYAGPFYSNLTGSYNVGIGLCAGFVMTGGQSENTFIGNFAGYKSSSGSYNTVIGTLAGYNIVSASSNVLIGRRAGYTVTGSSNTIIGSIDGLSGWDGVIAIGAGSTTRIFVDSTGNTGLGTTSPSAVAKLDITSTTSGVLFPRMTTTQKNAIAAVAGLVVYDTTTNKLCCYNGSTWNDLF